MPIKLPDRLDLERLIIVCHDILTTNFINHKDRNKSESPASICMGNHKRNYTYPHCVSVYKSHTHHCEISPYMGLSHTHLWSATFSHMLRGLHLIASETFPIYEHF